MGSKAVTSTLDSIAINHTDRKYNKVSAIVLKPDAQRFSNLIRIKPGSLKEDSTGSVRCEVLLLAEDIESLYLAPLHRLS
ncbi:hypothetical protein ACXPWS_09140 [Mycobacterium sp. BMJ-28]